VRPEYICMYRKDKINNRIEIILERVNFLYESNNCALNLKISFLGAKVVMANRNMQLSENAAKKLRDEVPGSQVKIIQLNLASLQSVKECAEELLRTEPKIDFLINNAGK